MPSGPPPLRANSFATREFSQDDRADRPGATVRKGSAVLLFDTHFWTVFGLIVGCAALLAFLVGAALGGPPRRHHRPRHH